MSEQDSGSQVEGAAHPSPLLAAGGSTAPVFAHAPTVEYEVDLLLTAHEVKLVEEFRQDIRLCETDTKKFDKCAQKRDELLEENDKLVLRLAVFDHVMSAECALYRGRKDRTRPRSNQPKGTQENGAAKWDRFVGVATDGFDTIPKLLPPLRAISLQWGKDFVQHYQLAGKGQHYCNQFSAAIKPHTRENGIQKLNQLLLRRFRIPGRRDIRAGVNPIEPVDLRNLASWRDEGPFVKEGDPDIVQLQFVDLTCEDIPPGFVFDQFGLMVRCPPGPLAGLSFPDSGLGGALESIADTTSTEEVVGVLPAAVNISTGDADPVTPLTAVTTPTSPSHSELSTPLSLPPDFLANTAAILPPHAPSDAANAMPDPSITSEEFNRTDSDTDGAMAEDGLDPANVPEMPPDCCPKVPPSLRLTLTNPPLFNREAADQLFPFLRQLCREHLQRYAELRLIEHLETWSEAALHTNASTPFRRRRASLSDITTPSKRPRLEAPLAPSRWSSVREDRPVHDHVINDAYRRQVIAELCRDTLLAGSHGEETNQLVCELLDKVQHPNTDSNRGVVEALFCTSDEAARVVESRSPIDVPIITKDQQPFKWGDGGRPIEQFFRRMCILNQSISVQIPSRSSTEQSFEVCKLRDVRERFLAQKHTSDPWNVLDLQSPVPSILPRFLTGENCELLLHVRNRVLMAGSAERVVASTQQWNEWKDVDKWALLSQGGHHTAPHMDSHGYATWITVQEGSIGFGWISCPAEEEREAWMAKPGGYLGGSWRYIILEPGQTVFFGPGTIHFVFRVRDHQTLALGGHVLQWSGLQRWIQVILAELKNPATTNEEMEKTGPKLVSVVAELVEAKVKEARVEELGGEAAVRGFFESVKVRICQVNAVAFSPVGRLTVSGSGDKTVQVWDAATGAERRVLQGHPGSVYTVAFSLDGRLIISGSHDKSVRVWDAARRQLLPIDICYGKPAVEWGG
ncbi:ATP synthase subunit alpha [Staphylotrichum tortipilum]|uniref:ATP synthase subunit alpha n=1 Tax=Staphylotrichum tortipilum TaxID=2831512 RepID=A0AAN6MAC7_9PEZI|nr:ATP synthase subunit alpha [Staphylotrichum longicolle]